MPTELSAQVAAAECRADADAARRSLLIYFILGCFMESLAMVLLTLPIFVPLMLSLDFGLSHRRRCWSGSASWC